jgi:hypothetical protein
MNNRLAHTIKTKPLFLFLLPVFFVLHGFRENYDFVPVRDALHLTGLYLLASAVLIVIFWWLFRDIRRAGLFAFLIMGFHFFFGSIHDTAKKWFPDTFIIKYSFILPAVFLFFIILIIFFRKKKPVLLRTTLYLNVVLLILIIMDVGLLLAKTIQLENKEIGMLPSEMIPCDSCSKPDVYVIIPDEYAGNTELKEILKFDNSEFINQLTQRGFHTIPYSFSNYNYTPFSIASILNMQYLYLEGRNRSKPDVTYCFEMIRDNRLLSFLAFHGYDFYNYSFFDFKGQPARVRESFLPAKTRLITGQTFLSRFDRDIRYHLITRFKSKAELRRQTYKNKANNENILHLTTKTTTEKTSKPKFIFTHLMLPHYPYYYDKDGNEYPFEQLVEGTQGNQEQYIQYLLHSNKRLLTLIDHILKSSRTTPMIVLMGDHGFRHFVQPVDQRYYFLNHASILLPSNNYSQFSDSMSAVNILRTAMNTEFGQKMPYLKDSMSYLKD